MLLRQLFDRESYTFTYLIGDVDSAQAALIDPVIEQVEMYVRLLEELGLKLHLALDTHVHADHITALGRLRELTGCKAIVGLDGEVACATEYLVDGKQFRVGAVVIQVLHTPGHTDDSFTFVVNDDGTDLLFTGDTLLIRGTGRTDFQNGDPGTLYDSLHEKILRFPDESIVYPGHDYKGWTSTTIGEEKRHNPRLQTTSREAFVELMNNLDLPNPKMMDVAVPANLECGL